MAYRTVKESFWTDPKIRQLSSDEKLLFLYCVTNPHSHYSGIYYLPVVFMIEETGMSQKTLIQCLANLESRLLIRYDKVTSTMFVVKMFKHQNSTGGNPKVIRSGVEKQLQNVHSHILINAFIQEYQYLNLTLAQGCCNVDTTLCQGTVPDTAPVPDTGSKVKSNFTKPTVDEVEAYCQERKNNVNPRKWFDHYTSNGWKIGRALAPMKDWKAAIRTWENNDYGNNSSKSPPSSTGALARQKAEELRISQERENARAGT